MPKNVDDLVLEEGIEIPDDPLAIEAMLEEEEAARGSDDPGTKGKPGEQPDKPGTKDDDSGKAGDEGKPKGEPESKGKPGEHEEAPAGPPQAVLRRERENRHKAEELLGQREEELGTAQAKIAELETALAKGQDKLQAHADRATGDPSIKLESLDKAKLEALRADLDDDVVNFLGRLVDQHNAIVTETSRLKAENAELMGERDRAQVATQQDDIDSVPLLAVIQATRSKDADLLWGRAVAYETALQSDPDWADKTRSEIYEEVGRRLNAYLGDDAAKWLEDTGALPDKGKGAEPDKGKGSDRGKTVEDKLASARARATPDSLSDLPTGHAAAQHEVERLEAMTIHDAEDLINKAIDKGNLDEVLQRLSSAQR
jgi:Skp family chaperone for outer membrane proteins